MTNSADPSFPESFKLYIEKRFSASSMFCQREPNLPGWDENSDNDRAFNSTDISINLKKQKLPKNSAK